MQLLLNNFRRVSGKSRIQPSRGVFRNVVTNMASSLPSFPPFDMDEDQSSVGPRWSKWVNRFDNFLAALNITDDARRKALILHYGGERVFEIFETLDSNARVVTPATGTTAAVNETCYEAARRALNDYFAPRVNTDFEMFTFRQSRQLDGESFDAFHTRLQQSAKNCGFTDKDREIKAQLTIGCTSTELRRKIL